VTFRQHATQPPLEGPQAALHDRLVHAQGLRCGAGATMMRNRQEVTQVIPIKHAHPAPRTLARVSGKLSAPAGTSLMLVVSFRTGTRPMTIEEGIQ
jgi:hypothetical protein